MSSNESKTTIKPIGDRVVVRRLTEEESGTKSAAGIIIPDTVKEKAPEQGIVIAVGEGKWNEDGEKRIPMDVKVGDRIAFTKYGQDEIKVGGEELYVVSMSAVLVVLE